MFIIVHLWSCSDLSEHGWMEMIWVRNCSFSLKTHPCLLLDYCHPRFRHIVIPQIKPELLKLILLNGWRKYHLDEAEVMVKTRTRFKELSVRNNTMFEVRRLALVVLKMCWVGLPDELQCTPLDKKKASEVLYSQLMTGAVRIFSRGVSLAFLMITSLASYSGASPVALDWTVKFLCLNGCDIVPFQKVYNSLQIATIF